ncbi:MAG: SpoIIE family protein phosphatase [Candidatus Zixiibacteriota bacterium]
MSGLLDRLRDSKESVEKLALVAEAAHMLNSTIEYEDVLKSVLQLLTKAVNAEGAMVYRYDAVSDDLRGRFFYGDTEPQRMNFMMGQGFVGWVAQNGKPAISNCPLDDERYHPAFTKDEDFDLKSIICYPLTLRGDFFGVIEAINARDGKFEQSDLDTLEILSDQIALAINNAQLYRSAVRKALEKKTLFDVSRLLMTSLNLDEVLHNILIALKNVIEYHSGGVYLIKEESQDVESISSIGYDDVITADLHLKLGQGIVGNVAKSGQPEIISDVSKDIRYINARPETKSEIVMPIKLEHKLVGVLNLEHNNHDAFSEEDKEILTMFATQAAISIERARLHKYMLDQKKIEEQLHIARTIQETFLPDEVPVIDGYDLWGANIPSGEVGGDYYDFINIVQNQFGISIADVSGKGIPAALIMASFRASLIAEIRNNYAIRTICRKVNNLLCESLESENFVTAIYGVLDSKNSIFTFSNCGHNPGLLVRMDNSVEELIEGGLILGVRPDVQYEERPIYINSGDILCLFTDGITEAENNKGEQFETERMIEIIKKHRKLSASEIGHKMLSAVHGFASPEFVMDDLTVILLKRS